MGAAFKVDICHIAFAQPNVFHLGYDTVQLNGWLCRMVESLEYCTFPVL